MAGGARAGRGGRKGDSVRLRLQNIYGQNKWQLLAAAQVPHNGIDDVQEAYVVVAGSKGDTEREKGPVRGRETLCWWGEVSQETGSAADSRQKQAKVDSIRSKWHTATSNRERKRKGEGKRERDREGGGRERTLASRHFFFHFPTTH